MEQYFVCIKKIYFLAANFVEFFFSFFVEEHLYLKIYCNKYMPKYILLIFFPPGTTHAVS